MQEVQHTPDIEKIEEQNCAGGKCPFSSPRLMSFLLPFFAVLAIEQWATSNATCISSTVCQMDILSKSALAALAGIVGLGIQKAMAKR